MVAVQHAQAVQVVHARRHNPSGACNTLKQASEHANVALLLQLQSRDALEPLQPAPDQSIYRLHPALPANMTLHVSIANNHQSQIEAR